MDLATCGCFIPASFLPPELEEIRLRTLQECGVLDTDANDHDYDRFTALARRIFNVPIALISLVDMNRQYLKSHLGLDCTETTRQVSFCAHAILQNPHELFIVMDTYKDLRFKENPLVIGAPFIRFYAGAVIVVNGCNLGTICIIDTVPHSQFSLNHKLNLFDLATAVSTLLSLRRDSYLKSQSIRKDLVLNMMQSIRTPLTSLNLGFSLLNSDRDDNKDNHGSTHSQRMQPDQFVDIIKGLNGLLEELNSVVADNFSKIISSSASSDIDNSSVPSIRSFEAYVPRDRISLLKSNDTESVDGSITASNTETVSVLGSDAHATNGNDAISNSLHGNTSMTLDTVAEEKTSIARRDNVRVLLVEDSLAISKMMKKWLEVNGCEVVTALNGELALTAIKNATDHFDIVITDFLMPVMDGITFIKELASYRQLAQNEGSVKDALILGMSATASREDQEAAFGYGMHHFAAKPVDLKLLHMVIDLKSEGAPCYQCVAKLAETFGSIDIQSSLRCDRDNKKIGLAASSNGSIVDMTTATAPVSKAGSSDLVTSMPKLDNGHLEQSSNYTNGVVSNPAESIYSRITNFFLPSRRYSSSRIHP